MDRIVAILEYIGSALDALLTGGRTRPRSSDVIALLPPLPKPPVKAPTRL